MPASLALVLCIVFVAFLLRAERRHSRGLSIAVWIPTLWMLSVATKPLGRWFGLKIDTEGKVTGIVGGFGKEFGEFRYPYDVAVDKEDNLYVCEYGNSRIQKFSPDGEFVASWGRPGKEPGTLWCPWGVALDSKDKVLVADTNNQRVIRLEGGIGN